MATINESVLTLQQFLSLPETQPASEYIEGTVVQKPMSKGKHSELQRCLCERLNALRPIARAQALSLRVPADRLEHGEAVPGVAEVFSAAS